MQIVVATHNEGKLVEIRRILEEDLGADAENIELVSAGSLHLPDPVETGVTFQENALLKARAVAIRTGLPAVADDSGLIVDVMGNAPGILSARWAGAHGHDKANNALLLAQIMADNLVGGIIQILKNRVRPREVRVCMNRLLDYHTKGIHALRVE